MNREPWMMKFTVQNRLNASEILLLFQTTCAFRYKIAHETLLKKRESIGGNCPASRANLDRYAVYPAFERNLVISTFLIMDIIK